MVIVTAIIGAALAATLPSPIGPASEGRMQCYVPNTAKKTCDSLSAYAGRADGKIDNTSWVLASHDPVLVMKTVTLVNIEHDEVCGVVTAADISAAEFTLADKPVPSASAGQLRDLIKSSLSASLDKKICTAYVPKGDGFTAQATVEGKRSPALDQPVIWVSPGDGYQVAP